MIARLRASRTTPLALLVLVAAVLAGCGGGRDDDGGTTAASAAAATPADGEGQDLSGSITADGSSTVAPLATAAAERFQDANSGVEVTVGTSGTGGGFERFCAGETDLSDASRPIKDEEKAACEKKGIEPVEFIVANDGISLVVPTSNDWATCLTTEQLEEIWEPGSKVKSWKQVDPEFPDEKLSLFGPGTDSGTFDFFTDEINGEEGASRTDYQPSEDDNVIAQGVAGTKGGLGYFGLSYAEANADTLKIVEVDGGDGCVAPSTETVQDGSYRPLSRPLFVYAKREALARPEVLAFLRYIVDNETEIADEAKFVPLTDEQIKTAEDEIAAAQPSS